MGTELAESWAMPRTLTKRALTSPLLLGAALVAACSSASGVGGGADGGADGGAKTEGASCRLTAECKAGFEQCLGPGEFGGCGAVASGDCDTDEDCSRVPPTLDGGSDATDDADAAVDAGSTPDRRVCGVRGPCQQRGLCVPACTSDLDCPSTSAERRRCDLATGKCEIVQCSSDAECDASSRCSDGPVRLCTRRACKTDGECPGACVNGGCFATAGKCTPLPQ